MAARWRCCLADQSSETRVSAVTSSLWSVQTPELELEDPLLRVECRGVRVIGEAVQVS